MGASTSGLLRATVVPSKVLAIPDTVPIPKVLTVSTYKFCSTWFTRGDQRAVENCTVRCTRFAPVQ